MNSAGSHDVSALRTDLQQLDRLLSNSTAPDEAKQIAHRLAELTRNWRYPTEPEARDKGDAADRANRVSEQQTEPVKIGEVT